MLIPGGSGVLAFTTWGFPLLQPGGTKYTTFLFDLWWNAPLCSVGFMVYLPVFIYHFWYSHSSMSADKTAPEWPSFSRGTWLPSSLFLNALMIILQLGTVLPWRQLCLTTLMWDSWTGFVRLARASSGKEHKQGRERKSLTGKRGRLC